MCWVYVSKDAVSVFDLETGQIYELSYDKHAIKYAVKKLINKLITIEV